jgi:hypothetical protein
LGLDLFGRFKDGEGERKIKPELRASATLLEPN